MAGTRGLAAAVLKAAQMQDQLARVLVLLTTAAGTSKYYTSAAYSISSGGNTYVPRGIDLGDIRHGGPGDAQLTLEIEDTDVVLYGLRPLTNASVTVTIQVLDNPERMAGTWRDIYSLLWISTDAWGVPGEFVSLTLSPGAGMKPRHGLAEGSRSCPFAFKDANCGYGGATTVCDKSWEACGAMDGGSNRVHFGGLRYAPEPGDTIEMSYTTYQIGAPERRDESSSGGTELGNPAADSWYLPRPNIRTRIYREGTSVGIGSASGGTGGGGTPEG